MIQIEEEDIFEMCIRDRLPSNQDILRTQEVQKALHKVQIELIDHLIFTEDDYYSFNASGILTIDYHC